MQAQFSEYDAEVISVEDPFPEHRIIRFKLPEPIDFVPGQFVQVIIEGIPKPASFSIASSPNDKEHIELAFHTVGQVTGVLAKMIPGSHCKLRGPLGRFTYAEEDAVALAGGIGITPFICALRYLRDNNLPNKYTLLYSGKSKPALLYYDEIEEIAKNHENIDFVPTITREAPEDWSGETRRCDAEMIIAHVPDYKKRTFYLCGPKSYLDAMIAILKELEIPDSQIKRELW